MSNRFNAVVADVRLESRAGGKARWQLALDHTLFSSESDQGTLVATSPGGARLVVPVLGIVEEADTVWHIVEKPLTENTAVVGEIT